MIAVPITATSMAAALRELAQANAGPADLVELRLDYLGAAAEPEALVAASDKPCIATCRAAREGGRWPGEEDARLALLARAARAGAAYLDVEADAVAHLPDRGGARLIASYHNFERTPADLAGRVAALETLPCEVVKFATFARDLADNLRVWEVLARCRKPAIGLCMGELGEVSRVLALRQGSMLTFGALAAGRESAPGQLTARDLAEVYRVRSITAHTPLCAVVGDPIAHSVSPDIHNAAFAALGMDAAYLRFRVQDLSSFLEGFEPLHLQGVSVTIPHKAAALAAGCEAEDAARRIGAANTLTRTPRGWAAANTDRDAALTAVRAAAARAGRTLEGARALLLGAGGAARAIACGLTEAGCRLTVANRTRSRGEAVAADFGARVLDLDRVGDERFDVVANATSVGMHPHEEATPVDARMFGPGMVVFDAVYNPVDTRMLREARAAGAEVADGLAMFVGQAAAQFERWTGRPAPRGVMEQVVRRRLGL